MQEIMENISSLNILITIVISIILFFFQYLFISCLNNKGKVIINTKIIGSKYFNENSSLWGFSQGSELGDNNSRNEIIQFHLPIKFEILNNKNVDYCIRDICLYIGESEKKITLQQVSNLGDDLKFGESYGDFQTYSFMISKKSIKCFYGYFVWKISLSEKNNYNDINFNKIYLSYYDIKNKNHKLKLYLNKKYEDIDCSFKDNFMPFYGKQFIPQKKFHVAEKYK